MNKHLLSFLFLSFALASTAFAQFQNVYPFNTPVDPRSAAMGESFVAVPSNPAALIYNPAGLTGLAGLTLSYSHKSLDWSAEDWGVGSVTAAAGTPFGVFAAQYNRISMGTISVTTGQYPDGTGGEISLYSYNLALGYACRLPVGLALGISAKYYDFVESYSGPSAYAPPQWHSVPSYLFDFGLTYTLPRLHEQSTVEDSLTLGLAYQNMGSRWEYSMPTGYGNPPATETEYVVLPVYFRIGFSYAMNVRPTEEGGLSPFGAAITGEFRTLLNPIPPSYFLYPSNQPFPETSYWGFGLELTVYDILSVRGGAAFKPYSTVEADMDVASFRYGAGLRLPFRRIGIAMPLTLSFQYTVIPVREVQLTMLANNVYGYIDTNIVRTGTYPLFSLEFQYSGVPW